MSEARFLKATSTDEVIKFAKKHEVQFVDFKFTDLCGTWQHVTTSAREAYERCIPDGIPFDGSSIRGWKAIKPVFGWAFTASAPFEGASEAPVQDQKVPSGQPTVGGRRLCRRHRSLIRVWWSGWLAAACSG